MDDRNRVAITAKMEGECVGLKQGTKVKVSELELLTLCNLAEIGLMSMFAQLEGDTGESARADLERGIDIIRRTFAKDGKSGLASLMKSGAALLRSDRFMRFIAREEAP